MAVFHWLLWKVFSSQCFMLSIAEISHVSGRRRKGSCAPLITAILKCLLNVVFGSLSKHSSIFCMLARSCKFYVFRKELFTYFTVFRSENAGIKVIFSVFAGVNEILNICIFLQKKYILLQSILSKSLTMKAPCDMYSDQMTSIWSSGLKFRVT